jgi:hypothetical protein
MKQMAQVKHVLAKDLRQLWWPLAAYVGVVAFATVNAFAWPVMTDGIFSMLMVVVVVAGMFVVAMCVQADSPIRVDAFWATRPLAAWAVLLEKLLAVGVIVLALAVAGQFIALRTLDVPMSLMPGLLAESARQYALWLLIALVVAALTEDLRSFIVALVAMPIILLIIGTVAFSDANRVPFGNWPSSVLGFVALVGGVSLLAILYRTRASRKGFWLAALIVVGCAFASAVDTPEKHVPVVDSSATLPRPNVSARITNLDQIATARELNLVVNLEPSSTSLRWSLVSPAIVAHLRSGADLRIPLGQQSVELSAAPPSLGRGVTWIVRPNGPSLRSDLTIRLDDTSRAAIAGGLASVELVGRISVLEPRLAALYPLEPGRRFAHDGTRIAIKRWSHSSDNVSLTMQLASIRQESWPASNFAYFGALPSREFALLNEDRHEAIAFRQRTSSGGGASMVLPGTNVADFQAQYEVTSRNGGASIVTVGDDWFGSAKLAQIDWVRRGGYQFQTRVEIP